MPTSDWTAVIDIVRDLQLTACVKPFRDNLGSRFENIFSPVPNCIEGGGHGPWAFSEIEWIYIDPIRSEHQGRLLPNKLTDCTQQTETALLSAGFFVKRINTLLRVSHNKS
jgi:hypothetical protein